MNGGWASVWEEYNVTFNNDDRSIVPEKEVTTAFSRSPTNEIKTACNYLYLLHLIGRLMVKSALKWKLEQSQICTSLYPVYIICELFAELHR